MQDFGTWKKEASTIDFRPWPRREPGNVPLRAGGETYFRTFAPAVAVVEKKSVDRWERDLADYADDGEPAGFDKS
jgi:hypothetical protein